MKVALWAQDVLLCSLGLGPQFELCLNCGSSDVEGYSGVEGGVLCAACYSGSGFSLSSEALLAGRALRSLALEDLDGPSFTPSVARTLSRLYKEQFVHCLELSPFLFRRVLTSRMESVVE